MSINTREEFINALLAELSVNDSSISSLSSSSSSSKIDYKNLDGSKVLELKEFKPKELSDIEIFRKLNFDFPLIEDKQLITLLTSIKLFSSISSNSFTTTTSKKFNSVFCFTDKFSENLSYLISNSSAQEIDDDNNKNEINLLNINKKIIKNKSRNEIIGEIYSNLFINLLLKLLDSNYLELTNFFSTSTFLLHNDNYEEIIDENIKKNNQSSNILSNSLDSFVENRQDWFNYFNLFLNYTTHSPSSNIFHLKTTSDSNIKKREKAEELSDEIREGLEERNQYLLNLLILIEKFLPFVLYEFYPSLIEDQINKINEEIKNNQNKKEKKNEKKILNLYNFLLYDINRELKKKNLLKKSSKNYDDFFDLMFEDEKSEESSLKDEENSEGIDDNFDFTLLNYCKILWTKWIYLYIDLLCLYPSSISTFLPLLLDILLKPMTDISSAKLSIKKKLKKIIKKESDDNKVIEIEVEEEDEEINPSFYFSLLILTKMSSFLNKNINELRKKSYQNNKKILPTYLLLSSSRLKIRDYLINKNFVLLKKLYQVILIINKKNSKTDKKLIKNNDKKLQQIDLESSFYLLDLVDLLVYSDVNSSFSIELKNKESISYLLEPNFIYYHLLNIFLLLLSQYIYNYEGKTNEFYNVCLVEESNASYYWLLSSRLSSFFSLSSMYNSEASDALLNFPNFNAKVHYLLKILNEDVIENSLVTSPNSVEVDQLNDSVAIVEENEEDEMKNISKIKNEVTWFSSNLLFLLIISLSLSSIQTSDQEGLSKNYFSLDHTNQLKDQIIKKYQYKFLELPSIKPSQYEKQNEDLLTCLNHKHYQKILTTLNELKEINLINFHDDFLILLNKKLSFSTCSNEKMVIKEYKKNLHQFYSILYKSFNYFKINFSLILTLNEKFIQEIEENSSHNLHSTNNIRDIKNLVQLFTSSLVQLKLLMGLWEENTSNKSD